MNEGKKSNNPVIRSWIQYISWWLTVPRGSLTKLGQASVSGGANCKTHFKIQGEAPCKTVLNTIQNTCQNTLQNFVSYKKLKLDCKTHVKTHFKAMLNEYNIEYAAIKYKTPWNVKHKAMLNMIMIHCKVWYVEDRKVHLIIYIMLWLSCENKEGKELEN